MLIYLNGKIVPESEANVSFFDHGLLYGDGVFEGIRAYDGNIFRLKEHVDRLFESAKTLWLNIGMTPEEVEQATVDTVAANNMRDAYIRLVITRGKGDLGIDPDKCPKPTFFIIVSTIALYPAEMYEQGIPLVTASTRIAPARPRKFPVPAQRLGPWSVVSIALDNHSKRVIFRLDVRI